MHFLKQVSSGSFQGLLEALMVWKSAHKGSMKRLQSFSELPSSLCLTEECSQSMQLAPDTPTLHPPCKHVKPMSCSVSKIFYIAEPRDISRSWQGTLRLFCNIQIVPDYNSLKVTSHLVDWLLGDSSNLSKLLCVCMDSDS